MRNSAIHHFNLLIHMTYLSRNLATPLTPPVQWARILSINSQLVEGTQNEKLCDSSLQLVDSYDLLK
jgi:hypothetical protein